MHPVRLVVADDDLRRSRLTVVFRLLLALPHVVWLALWSIGVVVVAPLQWIVALARGRPSEGLHDFLGKFVRYGTHVYAYLLLAANPYPGFSGGSYVVDVELPEPGPQRRSTILFRLLLALPALVLLSVLVGLAGGGPGRGGRGDSPGPPEWLTAATSAGIAFTFAVLAWFAILARGRIPRGFRDFLAFALRYGAQTWAYVLLLTDRYPDFDPGHPRFAGALPPQGVRLRVDDDLRRSRLTVFFRFPLTFPHFVWLLLWGVATVFAAVANWAATLVRGRPPLLLHRFLSAYVRYATHVYAFLFLVANPFPGFTGAPGYPVDVEVDPPERQRRLVAAFRLVLAVPAFLLVSALGALLLVVGVFGWFASLALGRMPEGLRNAGAYVLRYVAQTSAYGSYVLTERYPYSGPSAAADEEPEPVPGEDEPHPEPEDGPHPECEPEREAPEG
jgi:hypothetical protein